MAPVEIKELKVFLILAEELHFGRTAERLGLTQSRVSQVLRDLERKLGDQLVYRTSRRVELTEFGAWVRIEAGASYQQLVDTLERVQAPNRERSTTLRLGLFSDPAASQIPRIVKMFEAAHPEVVVQAAEVAVDEPFGRLIRGEVDLIASWLPHGQTGLVTGPILSSEPRVLAVSTDHPLAKRTTISIEDVAPYTVMHFDTMPEEFLETWIPSKTPSGKPIHRRRFSDQSVGDRGRMTSELLFNIATGRAVHPTVPSFANMFGDPGTVYVPITDLPPLRSALVWRRRRIDSTAREFIRTAREVQRSTRQAPRGPDHNQGSRTPDEERL